MRCFAIFGLGFAFGDIVCVHFVIQNYLLIDWFLNIIDSVNYQNFYDCNKSDSKIQFMSPTKTYFQNYALSSVCLNFK